MPISTTAAAFATMPAPRAPPAAASPFSHSFRGNGDAERLCDLGIRPALELAHRQSRALIEREPSDRAQELGDIRRLGIGCTPTRCRPSHRELPPFSPGGMGRPAPHAREQTVTAAAVASSVQPAPAAPSGSDAAAVPASANAENPVAQTVQQTAQQIVQPAAETVVSTVTASIPQAPQLPVETPAAPAATAPIVPVDTPELPVTPPPLLPLP